MWSAEGGGFEAARRSWGGYGGAATGLELRLKAVEWVAGAQAEQPRGGERGERQAFKKNFPPGRRGSWAPPRALADRSLRQRRTPARSECHWPERLGAARDAPVALGHHRFKWPTSAPSSRRPAERPFGTSPIGQAIFELLTPRGGAGQMSQQDHRVSKDVRRLGTRRRTSWCQDPPRLVGALWPPAQPAECLGPYSTAGRKQTLRSRNSTPLSHRRCLTLEDANPGTSSSARRTIPLPSIEQPDAVATTRSAGTLKVL